MELINQLRDFYGFPQAVLAQYVGVSRGHFSMAAIGRKDLQTAAFLKLSKLALAVKNECGPEPENIRANHRSFLKDNEAGFVNYKILETEHRLVGCQRKLRCMQIKHRQAIHALACLAVLQANPEDPDVDHFKVMEMCSRKVLDKNSEVAQFDLELRIAGLEATAEFLRQRVAARERPVAAQANPEAANMERVNPGKMFIGVPLDDKSEVVQVASPASKPLEAKVAPLPGRPAVEDRLAAVPAYPEDLHMNQHEGMGIAPGRRLDKNSEVTQSDLELQTNGLNNSRYFSRRLYILHRRRMKKNSRGVPRWGCVE